MGTQCPAGRIGWARAAVVAAVAVLAPFALPPAAVAFTPPHTTAAAVDEAAGSGSEDTVSHATVSPSMQTVAEGEPATFTAAVDSGGPATIRWERSASGGRWTEIDGSREVLTVVGTLALDGDRFRAVVTIARASTTSSPVVLKVRAATGAAGPRTEQATPTAAPPSAAEVTPSPSAKGSASRPSVQQVSPSLLSTPTPAPPPATPPVVDDARPDSAPAGPAAGAPYGVVTSPMMPAGPEQTAIAHNFVPGAAVKVTLDPLGTEFGTYLADQDGTVTIRFSTAGLAPGVYQVTWTQV